MSLVQHAENELNRLLVGCEDPESKEMQEMINGNILEVVKVFSEQGHSGFSAGYAIRMISKLLNYKPITPLTGEDDEWNEVGTGVFQNKRCSEVFKENGEAYTIHGRVFSDNGGRNWFTSVGSRVPVVFPYSVPDKPEYIYLDSEGNEITEEQAKEIFPLDTEEAGA